MLIAAAIVGGVLPACHDVIDGQKPVGGAVDTEAEIQRFLRRAYLDLSGKPPSDSDLASATAQLVAAGNSVAARRALVDELIAKPQFGATWSEELENAIFAGNDLKAQYDLICGLVRGDDPACMSCAEVDSCACTCAAIQPLLAERTTLATSAADLTAGTKSSTIERRYAAAFGYFALTGTVENRVRTLFQDFLQRPAEADEIENGRAMIFGALDPNRPAGLLFHRHGSNYSDLVDIMFGDEIYREAIVRRVFARYLARTARPIELAHFTATLDATEPDLRGVVREVVSSREYFEQ